MSKITLRRLLTGPIVLPFTAGDAAALDAAARMMKRIGADGVPLLFCSALEEAGGVAKRRVGGYNKKKPGVTEQK